jgi:2-polyprenyl-3-methyl-5-hydroxy-6-metoxy-1,4-benzoquinol methylase
MFRVPKSHPERDATFYEHRYQEGFTTDCPNEQELANLKQTSFKGTEKDYASYIEVLRAAGLEAGDTVFDFGCSWGYGSWQLAQAGFRVFAYELSQSRARYAEEKLGCQMVPAPTECLQRVDCFFSAHVIEHLSNPGYLWETAKSVLKPNGVIVLFMPSGEYQLEKQYGKARYHKLWGQVHPLLLTSEALGQMAQKFSLEGCAYSSPYNAAKIAAGLADRRLDGEELLFVARRARVALPAKNNSSIEAGLKTDSVAFSL